MAAKETPAPRRIYVGESFECRVSEGGRSSRFRAVVAAVDRKSSAITVSGQRIANIERGRPIEVVFGRRDGACRFLTRATGVVNTKQGPALLISIPKRVDRVERRKQRRKPMKGTVQFSSAGAGATLSFQGTLKNLGPGGAMMSTMFGGIFAPGSKPVGVTLVMTINAAGYTFENVRAVVRNALPDPKLREIVHVNLAFEKLATGDRGIIERLVR